MAIRRYFVFSAFVFAFAACDNPKRNESSDSATMDAARDSSAVTAIQQINDPNRVTKDTVYQKALPPVFTGDLIFQNNTEANCVFIGGVTGSKYNHVGLIFQRERDGLLMVAEVLDSVRTTPLTDFVNRAVDRKVCVMRLSDAAAVLNEKRTKGLKDAVKGMKRKPFDGRMSWSDEALYSSEFVWKAYHTGLSMDLCPVRTVKDLSISADKSKEMKANYGRGPVESDPAVSPDDLMNSAKLIKVYESE